MQLKGNSIKINIYYSMVVKECGEAALKSNYILHPSQLEVLYSGIPSIMLQKPDYPQIPKPLTTLTSTCLKMILFKQVCREYVLLGLYSLIHTSSLGAVVSSCTADWMDWTDWLDRQVDEVGERGRVLPTLTVSLSCFEASLSADSETRDFGFSLLDGGDCLTGETV